MEWNFFLRIGFSEVPHSMDFATRNTFLSRAEPEQIIFTVASDGFLCLFNFIDIVIAMITTDYSCWVHNMVSVSEPMEKLQPN